MLHLQRLVGNIQPGVRHDQMEGRDYLVVPMVMMVEGVHQGSSGPLYYPAEELGKIPEVWNHKPVVVYHPTKNGQGVSACDPDVLTNHKIGLIMKTRFEDNKLKAEAWLDKARIKEVDERIEEAIENNTMMELSTGLFTDLREESGEFNGEPYSAIAVNYRPDHLAVLPDQIGACSLADGAGFLRLNALSKDNKIVLDITTTKDLGEGQRKFLIKQTKTVIENELSHSEVWNLLQKAVSDKHTGEDFIYIDNVYDEHFVYEMNDKLFRMDFSSTEDTVTLSGMPEEVEKVIEYKPVKIIGNERKELGMDKKQFVTDLIANQSTKWVEGDTDMLMALEESVLEKMEPVINVEDPAAVANAAAVAAAAAEAAAAELDPDLPVANQEGETVDAYIAKAPTGLQSVLRNSMESYKAEKAKLVASITANKKNPFTAEQLASKEVVELRQLATLAAVPEKKAPRFDGQGLEIPPIVDNQDEEEPLEAPSTLVA